MDEILGFFKEYHFLSNFEYSVVTLDGVEYKSVEHAYQAAKTHVEAEREKIRESSTPADAKRLGKKVTLRPDWEDVKLKVMEDLVREKFSRHEHFKWNLLNTDDAYLEETNWWGDQFWGVSKGKGENHLGKILMKIRSELQSD